MTVNCEASKEDVGVIFQYTLYSCGDNHENKDEEELMLFKLDNDDKKIYLYNAEGTLVS